MDYTRHIFKLSSYLGILIVIFLISCSRELYDLSVKTVIADSKTKQPISGAYFDVTCVYQKDIDYSSTEHQRAQSDADGSVSLEFEKGYLFKVKSSCPGYLNLVKKLPARKKFPDTLFLFREPEITNLSLSVLSGYNLSETTPYIRTKRIIIPDVKKKKQPQEIWGFDFINNKATTNLDSADIWLEPKSTQDNLIFRTTENGGIYPVHEQELSQSFFLEIEYVPELKYYSYYKTNGTEKGYFVLCRDGKRIVKMIPDDYLCQIEYTKANEKIIESGVRLNYIIQKDTVNSNKFPLVLIYELLNKTQTTSLNPSGRSSDNSLTEEIIRK